MAQQKGANVVLVIDTETTYKALPGTPDAMVLPFVTESLRLSRALEESQTIRSDRNPQKPGRGNMDVAGDINFELSPQYGRLMKHIFGGYVKTGTAAPYTHTYGIGDLPVGMVVEKQFADLATAKYFQYNGCKVNSFKLAAKPSGMINCSVSLMGAKETIASSPMDATATDLGHTAFDGWSGSITQEGSPVGIITSIDFSLENGLDGDTYVIDGTGERYSLSEGRAAVKGNVQALFENTTLYALAIAHTETSLALAFTNGDGLGGTAGNEKLTFSFPEIIFQPNSPVVEGPKGLLVNLPFVAYYDNDAGASAASAVLLSPISTF